MMILVLKIAVAATLILLFPGFCVLGMVLSGTLVERFRAVARRKLLDYLEHHGRKRRYTVRLALFYKYVGSRMLVAIVSIGLLLQIYLAWRMSRTETILSFVGSVLGIALIGVVVTIAVLRKSAVYRWVYTSPVAKGAWATLTLVAVWLARSSVGADLGWDYGAASTKMGAALSAGTFLRTCGLLSVALVLPALVFEVGAFIALADPLQLSRRAIMRKRRRRALGVLMAAFLSTYTGLQFAFTLDGGAHTRVLLSDVAAEFDLFPEQACTGASLEGVKPEEVKRLIVFRNASFSEALVFERGSTPDLPVRAWSDDQFTAARLRFVATDRDCPLLQPIATTPASRKSGGG